MAQCLTSTSARAERVLWGAQGCQPVLFGSLPKSSLNVRCVWFLQGVGSRRQAANGSRLAACAPRNLVTSSLSARLRPRPRSRTRPRRGARPHCWQDVNHSSHSSKAVQGAEILVHARLRKSELIHEPCVVKDSGVTVHIIRRTKLPIGGAGCTTGDTVKIAGPGPAHGVAHADVDSIRHKTEFVFQRSHCYIKNLAPNVSLSTGNLAPVLIDDADCRSCVVFRCRVTTLVVSGFGGRHECRQKQRYEPPRLLRRYFSFCDHSMR